MTSNALISNRSPYNTANAGTTTRPIKVARGFGGRGYVVVDGFHDLCSAIERDGSAAVMLEGTQETLIVRRNAEGDLVRAQGVASP